MQLEDWLIRHNVMRYRFARAIGVTPSMITAYCEGAIWPSYITMEKLVTETKGEVTANDMQETCRRYRNRLAAEAAS
jgi:hypothetical protein